MKSEMRSIQRIFAVALSIATVTAAGAAWARPGYDRQVVSLSITFQSWNEDQPWMKSNPSTRVASAAVIDGGLLLTRAQVVADAMLIQAEKRGDARQHPAHVVHVDPEIDLALIAVDDSGFFDDLEAVSMARWLPTEGLVQSVRWRNRQLEVSDSGVGRVEVLPNRYANLEHAFLQVNSGLEGGGWAEPVFRKKRLVGLTASQQEQRAWIIPAEVLTQYIEDAVGDEPYAGFAKLGVVWQNSQDTALAGFLGLDGEPRGVLIRSVRRGTSACGTLAPRDILLELDGHAIDAIGNYHHPHYGRLRFPHLGIAGRAPGDRLSARVLRGGQLHELEIELRAYPSAMRLIPWRREDHPPPYLVAGGLVFRELDGPYIRSWGEDWSQRGPSELVTAYQLLSHSQSPERRRIIVLSSVLPDRYNQGYHGAANLIVEAINGLPIDSVADAADAFTHPSGDFHVIRLAPNSSFAEIVLDAASLHDASQRILEAYRIDRPIRINTDPLPSLGSACNVAASQP